MIININVSVDTIRQISHDFIDEHHCIEFIAHLLRIHVRMKLFKVESDMCSFSALNLDSLDVVIDVLESLRLSIDFSESCSQTLDH